MTILTRYILKNLLANFFVIVSALIIIFLLIAYFHFMSEAAATKLNTKDIARILVTEIPVLLQPILPLSLYLSILMVFRKMVASNEITVLRASGVGELSLFFPAICLGIIIIIVALYMQLNIFPRANTKRIHLFEDSIHRTSLDKIYPKQFIQLPTDKIVYIDKKVEHKNKFEGIFVNLLSPKSGNQLAFDVIIAQSLEEQFLSDKSKFILFKKGFRYSSKLTSLETTVIKFEQFGIRLANLGYRLEDWPGCMQTKALYRLSKIDRYAAAEYHWRISIPISTFNLTLFAVAFNKGRVKGYVKAVSTIYPLLVYLAYLNLLLISVGFIKNGMLDKQVGLWGIHLAMLFFSLLTIKYRPR